MADQIIVDDWIAHDGEKETEYDGVYYGKDKDTPLKRKILYLCNQKKCGESCSAKDGDCFWTLDLKYAKNYSNVPPNKTLDKHFDKSNIILDEPYDVYTERIKDAGQ